MEIRGTAHGGRGTLRGRRSTSTFRRPPPLRPPRLVFDFPERPDGPSTRRVYARPERVLVARTVDEVRPALAEVERGVAAGLHAAGYLAYEAAPAFDPAFRVRAGGRMPLVWFGLFEPSPSSAPAGSDADLAARPTSPGGRLALPGPWKPDLSPEAWRDAVAAVREELAAGNSYQVNLTTRMRAALGDVDPEALYARLRRAQGRGWHALLDLGEDMVVSVSPELFFHMEGRDVVTRPMKGTRPRGRWEGEDEARVRELLESEKELAENRMIVDLLRNDLGRVCETGSVRVPRLMDVERYPTVLQMTSTVTGRLREGVGLTGVLEALFPCGSVTGAPKVATMGIIAELERSPREVYCGAIGFVEGGTGRATFNVPIRTLWVRRGGEDAGTAFYGAGGGITWDSDAEAEHTELRAKAAVLEREEPDFRLLETMRAEGGGTLRLERHLARMASSARYFARPFPEAEIRRVLGEAAERERGPRRLRLTLGAAGDVKLEARALEEGPGRAPAEAGADEGLPEVVLAADPVDPDDVFLFHKTTFRRVYEAAREEGLARSPGAFDVLLHDGRGRVTEFTLGNVVAELDGRRVTPPVEAGLLAGCFRGELLEAGAVEEAAVTVADVRGAARLWLVNSVRGWVPVRLSPAPAPGAAASATARPRTR